MSSDGLVARLVGLDDEGVLREQLAFQARVGTPRHQNLDQVIASAGRVSAWTAVEVRDRSGALLACGEANLHPVFGTGSVQINAVVEHERVDVLRTFVDVVVAWEHARDVETLVAHVTNPDEAILAMWPAAGFEQVGTRTRLRRDVTEADRALPSTGAADGLRIVALADRPDLEPAADALWRETHADIPSALAFAPAPDLTVRGDLSLGPDDPIPPSMLLALRVADDELLGVSFIDRIDLRGGVYGHRMTGVARQHRGRGIARALKAATIAWAASNGVRELQASNDDTNPAIRRVNEAFGYVPVRQLVLFRRTLG